VFKGVKQPARFDPRFRSSGAFELWNVFGDFAFSLRRTAGGAEWEELPLFGHFCGNATWRTSSITKVPPRCSKAKQRQAAMTVCVTPLAGTMRTNCAGQICAAIARSLRSTVRTEDSRQPEPVKEHATGVVQIRTIPSAMECEGKGKHRRAGWVTRCRWRNGARKERPKQPEFYHLDSDPKRLKVTRLA